MADPVTFLKHWQINEKNNAATHVTGITFRRMPVTVHEKPAMEITNMPQWYQSQMAKGYTLQECDARLEILKKQFVYICQTVLPELKRKRS